MSSMPQTENIAGQINDTIVQAAITALAPFHPVSRKDVESQLQFWVRRSEMTEADLAEIQRQLFPGVTPDESTEYGKGYADGYVACIMAQKAIKAESAAERLLNETAARWARENAKLQRGFARRADCPDWCVANHRNEMDLISHEGPEYSPGISVMRTDCPDEGRTGKPVLYVAVDRELETWQQAAEMAHDILDGFGYLEGAE